MSYKLQETALMQVKEDSLAKHESRFVIEPLSPGFGLTVGNALRRVLLSSLEGAAITSIRIDGVSHEFSTIKGVREDAVDIILNLKQVRLKLTGDDSQIIVLDAKKAGVVKAGDFKCPTGVEVINKDLVIAELIDGGKILLEATVEKGRGYVPTELRKEEKLPIGVISIDSNFSPIQKVNFQTENTRVGKMTNFDKLILEIGTDGTVSPKEALESASTIIVEHFSIIAGAPAFEAVEEAEVVEPTEEVIEEEAIPAAPKVKKVAKVVEKTDKRTKKAAK
ncbi:MAG TPA: DNA-directed RNA polymerase subunit alpha [Candidatus Saccharimonadales bacterium]|nr:DNA-directed RNA polymerase subunit alpha [Candidatus Saccharimonadales bacterium]